MLNPHRTQRQDATLSLCLALIAGAINAGGFLAVGQYTSHMTGMLSVLADTLVLSHITFAGTAAIGIACFLAGSALAAVLVNWGIRHRPHQQYALPLCAEGLLITFFGLYGIMLPTSWQVPLCGVMLLCALMGLQNATIGLITNTRIRTTHVTGMLTDIGTELGHAAYRYLPRRRTTQAPLPHVDTQRLASLTVLVGCFFLGGVFGAVLFQIVGTAFAIPIGLGLILVTLPALAGK